MEEWKEYRLGELSIGKGSYGIGASAVPYSPSLHTYLRITDINDDGTLNKNGLMSLDDENADEYILQPNDIVFARTGNSTGRSYFYDGSDGKLVYAGFLIKFSLDSKKVNPRILKYYTHSKPYFDWVRSFDTGGTRGNINAKTYGDMPIVLPPRKLQDKIVSILKSLDDKIEVNRKINENLEQQAQALFKSWFVDFEPFKNGEFVESELGMIPKGWRVGKLGEICNVFTGKKDVKQSQPIGLYPFFSCSPNHTYSNEYIYDGPSIIIAGNGSYTGRTSFYFGKFDLYQRTYACTIKEGFNEKIISFLYYMMKCLFEPVKMGGTRGSSIPYIVMNDIVLQEFALDNSLMEKYSDFAYNVMKQIQQNNQESRRLAELRDTLLPKLMSGELKVDDVTL